MGKEIEEQDVALRIKALTKHFGGVMAVYGVDMEIAQGDIRAIIGPNGAGKTTLFNLITGDLSKNQGRVHFRGQDISRMPPYKIYRCGISRTFQITSIFLRLTPLENVQTALLSHHRRHYNIFTPAKSIYRQEALDILERVSLKEQVLKPSSIMSHGDQRRLELAIALVSEPQLLMLDEPTAGMAPQERRETMELVARIGEEEGLTILFTEHDMDVVFAVSKRITVMHQGRIIFEGKPQEVRANREVQRVYLGEDG